MRSEPLAKAAFASSLVEVEKSTIQMKYTSPALTKSNEIEGWRRYNITRGRNFVIRRMKFQESSTLKLLQISFVHLKMSLANTPP